MSNLDNLKILYDKVKSGEWQIYRDYLEDGIWEWCINGVREYPDFVKSHWFYPYWYALELASYDDEVGVDVADLLFTWEDYPEVNGRTWDDGLVISSEHPYATWQFIEQARLMIANKQP